MMNDVYNDYHDDDDGNFLNDYDDGGIPVCIH